MKSSSKTSLLHSRKNTLGTSPHESADSSVDGKGPALIVDVRCSDQYSNPEDTQGSESAQRLQTLNKQKKAIQSQIEMINSKDAILRDVLVAYASNDKCDYAAGLDTYDIKKLEVRTKREELQEELVNIEKKIQEVGLGPAIPYGHQVTGSNPPISSSNRRNGQGDS
jgi:hypothetical protein